MDNESEEIEEEIEEEEEELEEGQEEDLGWPDNYTTRTMGHEIRTKGGKWYYEDGEPHEVFKHRPCAFCGATKSDGYLPDRCLGEIPNIIGACCGHGRVEDSYLILEDETSIEGEAVWEYLDKHFPEKYKKRINFYLHKKNSLKKE